LFEQVVHFGYLVLLVQLPYPLWVKCSTRVLVVIYVATMTNFHKNSDLSLIFIFFFS
jgi:hypothetical protein